MGKGGLAWELSRACWTVGRAVEAAGPLGSLQTQAEGTPALEQGRETVRMEFLRAAWVAMCRDQREGQCYSKAQPKFKGGQ